VQWFDWMKKEIIVLGCGNILFGDDGFGVSVAEYLQNNGPLPTNASVVNAGTSVRGILFDVILDEHRPRRVIVIDAVDLNRKPGEVFTIRPEELPNNKTEDFTLHEMPTSNLLKELEDFCDVEVIIIAGQVESIPDGVKPGLSPALRESVPIAAEGVLRLCTDEAGLVWKGVFGNELCL